MIQEICPLQASLTVQKLVIMHQLYKALEQLQELDKFQAMDFLT